MPLAPEYFTADMVRAIPDDGTRYELVWGELLVTPAPRLTHQAIVSNAMFALISYCRRNRCGRVFTSPADISWSPDTLVQPDVFVVSPKEGTGREWSEIRSLDLVIEVLSPSTARHDRFQKRKLYQGNGVGTLWLVDPARRLIEVWTPDALFPVVETERVIWHPASATEPLVIDVAELLSDT
jgi:Uma2 family endonuclease